MRMSSLGRNTFSGHAFQSNLPRCMSPQPSTRLKVNTSVYQSGLYRQLPIKQGYNSLRHLSTTSALPASATASPSDAPATRGPEPLSAYIHLPFCKRKCRYCDFPVIAVGMRPDLENKVQDNMTNYVDALCREIAATKRLNESGPLKTLFFGGGTPSLIPPALLEQIISRIEKTYGLSSDAEISIEADPGTFNAAQLRMYKNLGVTRVSVGVQSFNDELLQLCGRAHDVADVYRAIESVYNADMPTWSLDLMSGLPELTESGWQADLEAIIDAAPHHVSVYDLQIEEHTPFAKQYRPGVSPLPSEESATRMYGMASHALRAAGYEHYEISNYAKPGHRCAHNMTYWEGRTYYAFGMGAASYLGGRRFSRPKRIGGYMQWLEDLEAAVNGEANKGAAIVPGMELPEESMEDKLTDTIMLRLRLSDGLDLVQLASDYPDGGDVADLIVRCLAEHEERGHVIFEREERKDGRRGEVVKIRLTDPEGFVVSNDVISDVFVALDEMKYA